jgi:hypothetical protein
MEQSEKTEDGADGRRRTEQTEDGQDKTPKNTSVSPTPTSNLQPPNSPNATHLIMRPGIQQRAIKPLKDAVEFAQFGEARGEAGLAGRGRLVLRRAGLGGGAIRVDGAIRRVVLVVVDAVGVVVFPVSVPVPLFLFLLLVLLSPIARA